MVVQKAPLGMLKRNGAHIYDLNPKPYPRTPNPKTGGPKSSWPQPKHQEIQTKPPNMVVSDNRGSLIPYYEDPKLRHP